MKFWNFNLHFFNRIFNKHLIQKSNRKSKTLPKKRKSSLQYFPEHRVLVTINFLVFTIDFKSKQNMHADFLILLLILDLIFLILDFHLLGSQSVLWKRHLLWKMHLPLPFWDKNHISNPTFLYNTSLIHCLFVCLFLLKAWCNLCKDLLQSQNG